MFFQCAKKESQSKTIEEAACIYFKCKNTRIVEWMQLLPDSGDSDGLAMILHNMNDRFLSYIGETNDGVNDPFKYWWLKPGEYQGVSRQTTTQPVSFLL